jgi:tRNA pseudouridine55 synthase
MKKVLELYKPIGVTPLELIKKFQKENPEYQKTKLAYAGRLDPMAEGLLLVLVGEECKKRKEYEQLPKTYEFEVLLGICTDTFDLMGKIIKVSKIIPQGYLLDQNGDLIKEKINELITAYKGELLQKYPPYSSPRINGKPLFWWARENRLNEIKIPTKQITIFNFKFSKTSEISSQKLLEAVHKRVEKVKGEFRQKEILEIWDKKLKDKNIKFLVLSFKITCSSGTYIRSIANSIGKKLTSGALAFSIKRTQIGEFRL